MAGLFSVINRLLPFATPGTPLYQDLFHLAVLCTTLYFAPQIQTYIQNLRTPDNQTANPDQTDQNAHDDPVNENAAQPPPQPEQQHANPIEAPPQPPRVDDSESDDNDLNEPDQNAPGPARPAATTANRAVGAKKAKSLARRDQRRAYHEFMRSQGDAQRARDAEDAAAREAVAATERERRSKAEAEVRAREAKEREERRERERVEREVEMRRREQAIGVVREELRRVGVVELEEVSRSVGGEGREWVERLVRASGMLRREGDEVTMLTERGWVVRVGRAEIEEMQRIALSSSRVGDASGKVSYQQLGDVLGNVLKSRTASAR